MADKDSPTLPPDSPPPLDPVELPKVEDWITIGHSDAPISREMLASVVREVFRAELKQARLETTLWLDKLIIASQDLIRLLQNADDRFVTRVEYGRLLARVDELEHALLGR